ncbi:MAG: CDP-alcohol phosphatidyltransferase family protein [Acetobacteraceae bacterium]|nr:CDP-alcohol phosphatidyltransferase family protein [Acetobacteraceae bacterium]
MIQATWTHLLARVLVRPLIGTGVTPNHLTTLRLISGVAACAALALGTRTGAWWGGGLWLVSAFLDRADGELARIGDMMSDAGHRYDFVVDQAVTAAFFVAIGIGLRHSWLGAWAMPLGLAAGGCLLLCGWWAERLEVRTGRVARAYSGRWGFDLDDLLYLLGPLAWLGWLAPVLIGAALGTATIAAITALRLHRLPRSA